MNRIIFYHPYRLAANPSKGSELRPKKMKEAFQNIGLEVDLVVGDSSQRKVCFKRIKNRIRKGIQYEFMYAESLNMPIPLADSHQLPLRPTQDFRFFRMLNKYSIPIGFFYRDLYWRVDELKKKVSFLKFIPKQLFHYIEWLGVVNTVDHLFIPTKSMAKHFPTKWPEEKLSALYPGCDPVLFSKDSNENNNPKLTLFYVGGITPPYYDLTPLIKVVNKLRDTELILCCRENDWKKNSQFYKSFNFNNITVVHADSSQIIEYYKKADIFFDIRKPEGYLKNTIPIKVVESIGYGVPLLLLDGTEPAELVKREGAGWVVNNVAEAKELLQELQVDKTKITDKVVHMRNIGKKHTWEKRAEKACNILAGLNKKK